MARSNAPRGDTVQRVHVCDCLNVGRDVSNTTGCPLSSQSVCLLVELRRRKDLGLRKLSFRRIDIKITREREREGGGGGGGGGRRKRKEKKKVTNMWRGCCSVSLELIKIRSCLPPGIIFTLRWVWLSLLFFWKKVGMLCHHYSTLDTKILGSVFDMFTMIIFQTL